MKSTSKMIEALRQFQAGATLHHTTITALKKRAWLMPDGKGALVLSPIGASQLSPSTPTEYQVERHT